MTVNLECLRTRVKEILADTELYSSAVCDRIAADAVLFRRVIDICFPVLKIVGQKPIMVLRKSPNSMEVEQEVHYNYKCVSLSDKGLLPKFPNRFGGIFYDARKLLVRADGKLVCFKYSSTNPGVGFNGVVVEYDTIAIAVLDGWHTIDAYISNLYFYIMDEYEINRDRIDEHFMRMEKVRAIMTLLIDK